MTHLAVSEHVAASTQNQALAAVLFLCQHVLQQTLNLIDCVFRAKRSIRLPVVLPHEEARSIIHELTGVYHLFVCRRHHCHESSVSKAIRTAARQSDIAKRVTDQIKLSDLPPELLNDDNGDELKIQVYGP